MSISINITPISDHTRIVIALDEVYTGTISISDVARACEAFNVVLASVGTNPLSVATDASDVQDDGAPKLNYRLLSEGEANERGYVSGDVDSDGLLKSGRLMFLDGLGNPFFASDPSSR